jgi:hypothetical protein
MSEPAVASLNPAERLAEDLILAALDIQSGSSQSALERLVEIINLLQTASAVYQKEVGVTIQ